MFIHSISPVSNIPRQNMLSYFSKDAINPGTLVEVLYGKNKILGVVCDSKPLKNVKEIVRTQDFQLRKIHKIIETEKIDSQIITTLEKWCYQNYVPLGKILTDIFPKWFWGEKFTTQQPHPNPLLTRRGRNTFIEGSYTERLSLYVKEILNHTTIWICIPNILALKKTYTLIKSDPTLTDYDMLLFHSNISEQKQIKQYKSIDPNKKTIILSTPYYFGLFNIIADLTIYENAYDDGYTLGQKHTYDALRMFQQVENKNAHYVYGGDLLDLDTLGLKNKKSVSFTGYTKENTRYNELFVSDHVEKQFLSDISQNKKILLVTQYKDNNIKIVCNDCKTTVTCPKCKLALRAITKDGISYFHCKFCKKSYKSNVKCTTCQSWNLTALGINTKTIKEFIDKKYKQASKELVTITSISDSEQYTHNEFDSVYVISIDGLMHSPHFTTEEKIVRTLLKLQEIGTHVYVQTSFPFPNILSEIKNVPAEKWKKEELKKRKTYQYPPFGVIYNITAGTIRDQKLLERIQEVCDARGISYIDALYRTTLYTNEKQVSLVEEILEEYRESSLLIKVEK